MQTHVEAPAPLVALLAGQMVHDGELAALK